jgi:UDPglucose--hexose-1-phosphate uridylyltransferase
MSEIRYNRLKDSYVIIAPERLHRPSSEFYEVERRAEQRVCPFCEGNEKFTPPEIFAMRPSDSFANKIGWKTRVVPNLYKAVQIEAPHEHHYGMFEHWDGFGAHEILIDTPEHHTSMTQWSEENVIDWFTTLALRVKDLRKDKRIASLSLFKNEGIEAGGTQPHSHTQIIGLPIVAKAKKEEYKRLYEHYKHNQNSLIQLLVEQEKVDEKRIVALSENFTAFCPYASSHPFEIMISSTKALGDISTLSNDSIKELAPLILLVLKKLEKQLKHLNFNLILSTPPLQENTFSEDLLHSMPEANRFYIQIIPRIFKYGGFEQETDILINPVSPELAAKLLRESLND